MFIISMIVSNKKTENFRNKYKKYRLDNNDNLIIIEKKIKI